MKRLLLSTVFIVWVGIVSAHAQVDSDPPVQNDEEKIITDTLPDDPIKADTAIMDDGKIIEDRLKVDTIGIDSSGKMELPSERTKNIPKRKSDE